MKMYCAKFTLIRQINTGAIRAHMSNDSLTINECNIYTEHNGRNIKNCINNRNEIPLCTETHNRYKKRAIGNRFSSGKKKTVAHSDNGHFETDSCRVPGTDPLDRHLARE